LKKMRKLHNWEVRDKCSTNDVIRTIFHPTLALYLTSKNLSDIKNLRIEVAYDEKTDKRFTISNITFYEDNGNS
jgi:hypothetical protein